jgi:hypothetical protein
MDTPEDRRGDHESGRDESPSRGKTQVRAKARTVLLVHGAEVQEAGEMNLCRNAIKMMTAAKS